MSLGEDIDHPGAEGGPRQTAVIARRLLALDLMIRPGCPGVNGAPCGEVAPIIHGARVQLV